MDLRDDADARVRARRGPLPATTTRSSPASTTRDYAERFGDEFEHGRGRDRAAARRRARVRPRRPSSPASRRRCSSARRSTTSACSEVLDALVDLAPPPGAAPAMQRTVQPDEPKFTGVVFKIQANMDPAHRDRIAFVRVASGHFERGMQLKVVRTGKELRPEHGGDASCRSGASCSTRPSPATSSAFPTTACCSWATRSPKARRCSSPACRSSRPRCSARSRSPIRCAPSSCAPA